MAGERGIAKAQAPSLGLSEQEEQRVAAYSARVRVWPSVLPGAPPTAGKPESLAQELEYLTRPAGWESAMPEGMYVPLQTLTLGLQIGIGDRQDPRAVEALGQLAVMVEALVCNLAVAIGVRGGTAVARTSLSLITYVDPGTQEGRSSWDPDIQAELEVLTRHVETWVEEGLRHAGRLLEAAGFDPVDTEATRSGASPSPRPSGSPRPPASEVEAMREYGADAAIALRLGRGTRDD